MSIPAGAPAAGIRATGGTERSMLSHLRRIRTALGAMCWIALAGCSEELPRVLIIALDGADMRQIERLSEQGRLPHLKALIEQGASGRLETVSSMSPVAWTSVATGVRPGKHGINAYVAFQGRPLSAVDRRRPAFWNILSHYRRTVGVIGWWLTFPAESVEGYLVSPYLHFRPVGVEKTANVLKPWENPDPRRTHPPGLASQLRQFIREPSELTAELASLHADDLPAQTAWAWARDLSARDIALHQMRAMPVETLAVYFQAIDVSSHDFTHIVYGGDSRPPPPPKVGPDERRRARALVDTIYEWTDAVIGDLKTAAGPRTDVIVLSDHGWEYDGTGHRVAHPGIFIAAGPSFASGIRLERVSMLDLLPTLLRILGIPVSKAIDGRVANAALGPDVPPLESIDRWPIEAVALPAGVDPEAEEDAAMLDLLRKLGYVTDETPEADPPH